MVLSKYDDIENKIKTSNFQREPTDKADKDEASDYASASESFRTEYDDPCQETQEIKKIEKKSMRTSNLLKRSSASSSTTDKVSNTVSASSSARSSASLSISGYSLVPRHEIEEIDEGYIQFSERWSSKSSLSSFSPSQPHPHPPVMDKTTSSTPIADWRKSSHMQEISSDRAIAFEVFTGNELRNATKNYCKDLITWRRANSTVYKGILGDERIVAVKKFRDASEHNSKVFANEIFILSKLNHINVAKMLGWCLEVEVPMLVLEYIPNGTLFQFIHERRDELVVFPLDTRLRIASEATKALAYLHSEASPHILHNDVKSYNILLDADYTVKISGFGYSSFLKSNDKNLLSTHAWGTLAYFDPEYFISNKKLTDKSDVYSFGVVLLELLTRKKPLYPNGKDEGCFTLSESLFGCVRENRLLDILDPEIMTSQGLTEQLKKVTNLVAKCLRLKGTERPTMKEVHMELEESRRLLTHPWTQDNTKDSLEMMICQTGTSNFQTDTIRNLGIDTRSIIHMNETRAAKDDNTTETISVGPWRYQTEYCSVDEQPFDNYGYDGIKMIIMYCSYPDGKINSIRIQYTKHGVLEWTEKVGQDEGDRFEIVLDDSEEYIMKVTGYTCLIAGRPGLCSLVFFGNRATYGPFGRKPGTLGNKLGQDYIPFGYSAGKLVGFKGTSGRTNLSSIGFYVHSLPNSFEKCGSKSTASTTVQVPHKIQQISVEPFGEHSRAANFFKNGRYGMEQLKMAMEYDVEAFGGGHSRVGGNLLRHKLFEHKECEGIKRIFIGHGRRINYFKVEYMKNGQPQMTEGVGNVDMHDSATEVILDYPNEFLQAVIGSYFVTFYDYSVGLVSLTFHTNLRRYGPFGYQCGQQFEVSGGKIVGFQLGASKDYLCAIGFYINT